MMTTQHTLYSFLMETQHLEIVIWGLTNIKVLEIQKVDLVTLMETMYDYIIIRMMSGIVPMDILEIDNYFI